MKMQQTSAVNRWSWLQKKVFQTGDLSSTARLVACALVSFVNDETLGCFPKVETLAKSTGLGERSVRNALNELAKANLVIKQRHAAGWFRTRNTYQLVGITTRSAPAASPIKPAPKPAARAASAPAADSASIRNTDLSNPDRRPSTASTAKTAKPKQALPALPSDQNELIEVVVRRWQQLSVTPWTLQNAKEHVGLAIERVGIECVTDRLNQLTKRRGLKHTDLLDHLQGLSVEQEIEPAEAQDWLGNEPEDWAAIARDFANNPYHNCPRPYMWLKRLTPSFDGDRLTIKADNPCVRDQVKNQFFDLLSALSRKRGFELVIN